MGVISYDEKTGSLEIQYGGRENPFTGVDSSAPEPYISPGGLVLRSHDCINIDNSIRAINFIQQSNFTFAITEICLGIGDLLGQVFIITYDTSSGNLNVYGCPNFPSGAPTLIQAINLPNYFNATPTPTPKVNSLVYKNINGVCFFSFSGCPYILQHNNIVVSILTSYLGASYLSELNGRLVALDVFKSSAGGGKGSSGTVSGTINASSATTNLTYNAAQYEWDGTSALRTVGSVGGGVLTDFVVAHGFPGLNTIPDGAKINGVTVFLTWTGENAGTGLLENIGIYYQGALIGTVKSPGTPNTNEIPTTISFGDSTDDWGATLTTAIVKDPTFGFGSQIQTVVVGSTDRSFLYTFKIQVDYTNPTNIDISGTSSATAIQNGEGTTVGDGTPIDFPAVPITAGQTINVKFDVNGSAVWTLGSGALEVEYSSDSGATWQPCFKAGTAGSSGSQNYSYPGNSINIPATGVVNLDQIKLRAVASATGSLSGNTSVSSVLSNISVIIGDGTGTGGIITEFPYQFAWSAPTGQYGQFSPLDNNNLVTGAGYNNLPDVEDIITGYFNIGPTGYILRLQGITEVSPLNSGIAPFDFNHLWASHKGIGTIYPDTVAQYGSVGIFFSDTGIYSIGYEGINVIDNKAKSAIFQELILDDLANLLFAGVGPVQIDGENFLAYIIGAQNGTTGEITLYLYNFNIKEWYRFSIATEANNAGLALAAVNSLVTSNYLNNLFAVTNNTLNSLQSWHLPVNSGIVFEANNETVIVFSAEEIKICRDITIDSIIIFYSANSKTATLKGTANINGIDYSDIDSTNAIFDGTWNYVILYPKDQCFTGRNPQLTLTLQNTNQADVVTPFYIGKAVLFGSFDATQRPA